MTLFLDASALVALVAEEPEAAALMASLDRDPDLQTSAIAVWEAAVGLARVFALPPCEALDWLQRFMEQTQVRVAPLDAQAGRLAIVAFERFGKGRHAAGLNMGDCFAYAATRALGAALVYKGDDFGKTDIERAP